MIVPRSLAGAAASLLLMAAPAHAQQTATPQSSPRLRRVTEVVRLLRASDEVGLAQYLAANAAPALLSTRPAERLARELLGAAGALGTIVPGMVEPVAPGTARVQLGGQGATATLVLGVEGAEPYRIVRLELGDGAAATAPPAGGPPTRDARREGPTLPLPAIPLTHEAAAAHLGAYVQAAVEQSELSGVVLLAHEGRPVYRTAVGAADRTSGAPMTPETRFSIGSINKMFTAVAIAQLVEQGKLSFTDPIAKYLPDYPNPEDARRIRIEHLLTHTSGLGDYFTERFMRERPRAVARLLELGREQAMSAFAPGTQSRYSNLGYAVLGAIVERVSGQDYYDYVTRHVLKPAGMRHTVFPSADAAVPGAATRHVGRADGGWQTSPVSPASPAGSAVSTADDLLRFAEALRTGRLVSPAMLHRMTTPKPELAAGDYGFGMSASTERPRSFGHNGGSPGVHAHLQIYPEHGYVFVMLTNQTRAGLPASNQYMVTRLAALTRALIADSAP